MLNRVSALPGLIRSMEWSELEKEGVDQSLHHKAQWGASHSFMWKARLLTDCLIEYLNVTQRVDNPCTTGTFVVHHASFWEVKFDRDEIGGGSIDLRSPGRLEMTHTVIVKSENYDEGSCLRTQGFSYVWIENNCLSKAMTRRQFGLGQTAYLDSQTNTSFFISNSVTECRPNTDQGQDILDFGRTEHQATINLNNFTENKLLASNLIYCYYSTFEALMNTITNNQANRVLSSSRTGCVMKKCNIVGNIRSKDHNTALLSAYGSLEFFECVVIANRLPALKEGSGTIGIDGSIFFDNDFDEGTQDGTMLFTHTLKHIYWNCEEYTIPLKPSRVFTNEDLVNVPLLFISVMISD